MALDEQQYHQLIDELQEHIETVLEATDFDIDIENTGGVLTIRFANGSQVILSRQPAIKQLWLAAKSGGYHLDYDMTSQQWLLATTHETLEQLLVRVIKEQTGNLISI